MEHVSELPLLGFRRRPAKMPCPVTEAVKRVCRKCAQKRWSALLTQTKSRIGFKCGMRKRLGEANWSAFVQYAKAEYKTDFLRALAPPSGVLCCEGKINGAPCPNGFRIRLSHISIAQCGKELPKLHMDHTHDLKRICEVWSAALPPEPRSWDDGICGPLVAHLLFGTQDHVLAQCSARPLWRKQIILRCGDVRGVQGQQADHFCHDVANAHYSHVLQVGDIKWG